MRVGQAGDVIVRRETPADVSAARAVQVAAFRRPDASDEPVEARLLDSLRVCDGWIPALSIVAELDSRIVGHVATTRAFVDHTPALGLGPIGVLPSHQRRGIGLALMHEQGRGIIARAAVDEVAAPASLEEHLRVVVPAAAPRVAAIVNAFTVGASNRVLRW